MTMSFAPTILPYQRGAAQLEESSLMTDIERPMGEQYGQPIWGKRRACGYLIGYRGAWACTLL